MLLEKVAAIAARFNVREGQPGPKALPRPDFWGGYRVWIEKLELWVSRPGRIHDRGLWTRKLTADGDGFRCEALPTQGSMVRTRWASLAISSNTTELLG